MSPFNARNWTFFSFTKQHGAKGKRLLLVSKRSRGCWRHEMLQRRIHAVLAPARIVPREVLEAEIIQDGVVLLLKEEVTLIC